MDGYQIDQLITMPSAINTPQMGPARADMAVVEPVQVLPLLNHQAMNLGVGVQDNRTEDFNDGSDVEMDSGNESDEYESMVDTQMSIEEIELPFSEDLDASFIETKVLYHHRN